MRSTDHLDDDKTLSSNYNIINYILDDINNDILLYVNVKNKINNITCNNVKLSMFNNDFDKIIYDIEYFNADIYYYTMISKKFNIINDDITAFIYSFLTNINETIDEQIIKSKKIDKNIKLDNYKIYNIRKIFYTNESKLKISITYDKLIIQDIINFKKLSDNMFNKKNKYIEYDKTISKKFDTMKIFKRLYIITENYDLDERFIFLQKINNKKLYSIIESNEILQSMINELHTNNKILHIIIGFIESDIYTMNYNIISMLSGFGGLAYSS